MPSSAAISPTLGKNGTDAQMLKNLAQLENPLDPSLPRKL
jgi:hypothetical protein